MSGTNTKSDDCLPLAAEAASGSDSSTKQQFGQRGAQILVAGMHRSGTSAVARLLNVMGAHVGDEKSLLPPHPTDNPKGYWERADIVAHHDIFLSSCGYSWNEVAGFRTDKLDTTACLILGQRLQEVISILSRCGGSWVVKDPRLCLVLSQWLPLLIRPACVVVLRDPRKIAMSIHREGLRGAYATHFLLALWEKYLRTLLAALQGGRALFVSYDRLLNEPVAESARLLEGLSELGATDLKPLECEQLAGLLDPRLSRSQVAPNSYLTNEQTELFKWLEVQSQVPSVASVDGFPTDESADSILFEYAEAKRHIVDLARHDEQVQIWRDARAATSAVTELREQVSKLQEQVGATSAAIATMQGENGRLEADRAELQTELARMTQRANAMQTARDDFAVQAERLNQTVATLEFECQSMSRARDRALDAAVKLRRSLDEKLEDAHAIREVQAASDE